MAISAKDKKILRDLAKKLGEVAARPIMKEKAELWRRLNSLERVRPMILLQNGTWHETGDQIELQCEDEFARGQEWGLRATLYHAEHMPDDTVYTGVIYSPIVIHDTSWGISANTTNPDHVFGARHYNCVIPDGADPASMIPESKVTVDWDETEKAYQRLTDIYDGVLPVEKRGVAGYWFAIMDQFIQWRSLDKAFMDMVDNPKWLHTWLEWMTRRHISYVEQCEKLGVLSLNNGANGVGPGGLAFTDELPQKDFDGKHVRAKDQWAHATTQIFSLVSPAMHEEFALAYEKRFLSRFGLAGYGCCEPLDMKVDIILKHIPNLRRLSMSPWVDVARGAAALGKKAVFSYKPNPAILGMESWDRDLAERQLRDVLEKTRGCVVEVIMKDLHTVRKEPQRMWDWVALAMRLAEEYA